MKKLIFKCLSMVFIFVGISQYMMYLMTGKSPLADLKWPSFSLDEAASTLSSGQLSNLNPVAGKDVVYKWVDAQGVTQYSHEPPPDSVASKRLELDENTNVIQGLKLPEEEAAASGQQNGTGQQNPVPQLALPEGNLYSPQNIKKVIDDAKNVQKMLNERVGQQEQALKDL